MYIKQLFITLISCFLVACASHESTEDGDDYNDPARRTDCIFKSTIRGYEVLDESNLIVTAGASRKYHLVLSRRAYGLKSTWGIAFDSTTGSVCAGFDEVVFDGHFDNESIRIANIKQVSDDEYEDLLIRFGKKQPEIERTPPPADVEGAEVEELDPAADDETSGG